MAMFKLKEKVENTFVKEAVVFIHDATTSDFIRTVRASECDGLEATAFYLLRAENGKYKFVEKTNDPKKAEKWLSEGAKHAVRIYQ